MVFKGCATALVTPFNKNGEVDYYSLKNLIEFQIANGVKGLVVLGTTGEAPTITQEERTKIIKFCVCLVSKRVPLIVGCGSNSTSVAIKHVIEAESLGADAVLVVTPYYNKCSQFGLIKHYKAIASSTKLPVIVYNVPSRTGVNILPETMLKIAKLKNIVGIKEACGNINQLAELCKILPNNISVYSGDDLLTMPAICLGANGVISVTSNCYPELVQNMCDFAFNHDLFNAKRLHEYLFDINKALFLDVNPICVKFYMNLIGFNVGTTRLPLTEPNIEVKQNLKGVKNKYEN